MKIGLALPSFVDDVEVPLAVARSADDAGLDGVFVYDHVWRGTAADRRPALECFSLLGAVASETRRVAVGTLVVRATLRPAATTLAALDTVQRISDGRLIAALGSGDAESRAENEAFGLDYGTLAQRLDRLHDTIRAAHGRGYPVWVGGNIRHLQELVVLADGWNAWGLPVERFAADAAHVRAQSPGATCTWGGLVLVGADDAHAADKARGRTVGDHVVQGSVARVAERLRRYADAGADWVVLGPLDSSDPHNARLLAEARP